MPPLIARDVADSSSLRLYITQASTPIAPLEPPSSPNLRSGDGHTYEMPGPTISGQIKEG